jgi:putative CocE/NonD family hydrolase
MRAPALLLTGWYDWGLNDALATWEELRRSAPADVADRCRIVITPQSHAAMGYREGAETHPELQIGTGVTGNSGLHLRWYEAVRVDSLEEWPRAIFYLMGANEWRCANDWPVPGTLELHLYLRSGGLLSIAAPQEEIASDHYVYDPNAPTPTVGGGICSFIYPTGSVDVSEVQKREDVLVYTTEVLANDLDVVGPLRMTLYASSDALDTDFGARLSDVFPDGRALHIQSGMLRARYRGDDPQPLTPGRIHELTIDIWATANRFKAGHRLRLDIYSADFPRFDRNSNLGGAEGDPVAAHQGVHRDKLHPSHLTMSILGDIPAFG